MTPEEIAQDAANRISAPQVPHAAVAASRMQTNSPLDDSTAAQPFSEPEVPTPGQFIVRNTLGLPVKGLEAVGSAIGAVGGALDKGYKFLTQPAGKMTAGTAWIPEAPKTAIEKAFALEQVPENLVKKGAAALLGDPTSGYGRSFADILSKNAPAVASAVTGGMAPKTALTSPGAQEALKDIGVIGDVAADPMWWLKPFGLTKAGEAARMEGAVNPNVGEAIKSGQRAVLTAGNTPLLKGDVAADALSRLQNGAFDVAQKAGFTRMTLDPGFNSLVESKKISPMSNANYLADTAIGKPLQEMIERNAKDMGITPQELQVKMADFREPPGSQQPLSFTPEEYQKALGDFQDMEKEYKGAFKEASPNEARLTAMKDALDQKGSALAAMEHEQAMKAADIAQKKGDILGSMPPEIQEELLAQQKRNLLYALDEGQAMRPDYLHHVRDPQWVQWLKDNFSKASSKNAGPSLTSEFNPADMERDLSNYTKNEVNNLASQGRLGEIMTSFPEQFNQYRGPVFDDNMARIEASRYLAHRSAMTSRDMMTSAGEAYGKTKEALNQIVGGKPGAMKDWVAVSHPAFSNMGGTMWFPKQIGNFLNNVGKVAKDPQPILNATNRFVKFFNYGAFPKSALKNYGSNVSLAYLNGMFNPLSPKDMARYPKALQLVARSSPENRVLDYLHLDRSEVSPLGDDVVLKSPIYGDVTSKQLMEMAHANRGIGMGPARSFVAQGMKDEGWLQHKVPATLYDLHNLAEDASRLPVFMKALEEGATWEGAGKLSRDSLYDYSNMGERDAKWASWIPFYRFARLNMPNILTQMVQNPARTLAPENIRESVNQRRGRDDEWAMNRWQKEAGPIYTFTDKGGNPHYAMMQTFFPLYDLNRFFGTPEPGENPVVGTARSMAEYAASSASPFIKSPLEAIFNYNTDYKQPIDRNLAAGLQEPEMVPTWAGPMTAKEAFLMRQFRPFSEAQQVGTSNPNVTGVEKAVRAVTGINSQPVDVDKARVFQAIDQKKNIQNVRHLLVVYARKLAAARAQGDSQAEAAAIQNIRQIQGVLSGGGVAR